MKKIILNLSLVVILIGMMFSLTGCLGLLGAAAGTAYMINAKSKVVESVQPAKIEVDTFNSKFTRYEGYNVSASDVRTLVNIVTSSNVDYPSRKIELIGDVEKASDIKSSKKYRVTCDYDNSGLINKIAIYEK